MQACASAESKMVDGIFLIPYYFFFATLVIIIVPKEITSLKCLQ